MCSTRGFVDRLVGTVELGAAALAHRWPAADTARHIAPFLPHVQALRCRKSIRLSGSSRWRCSQSQLFSSRRVPSSSSTRSPLALRVLSTYRQLLRAASHGRPPAQDGSVAAAPPEPVDLPIVRSKTRHNIRLVFRARQAEREQRRIEGWLEEAETIRQFLLLFHSLPPHVRNDFFRKPQPPAAPPAAMSPARSEPPPPPSSRSHQPVAAGSADSSSAASSLSSSSSPAAARDLRFFHSRAYAAFTGLLTLSISPEPSAAPSSPSEAAVTVLSRAASSSSPWLEWLRSTRPVSLTIQLLEWLHSVTGGPWWLTLVLAAVLLRTALLPVVVYQLRVAHEMWRLSGHFALVRQMVALSGLSWGRRQWEAARMRWALYWRYGCHPVKLVLPGLLQLGALVLVAVSLRPLLLLSPDLQTGVAWLPDLSQSDPLYLLPIAVTAAQYALQQYTDRLAKQAAARRQAAIASSLQPAATAAPAASSSPLPMTGDNSLMSLISHYRSALTILVLPVVAGLPSGLFVFQLTTTVYQLLQAAVLGHGTVRRVLGLEAGLRPVWRRSEEATAEQRAEWQQWQEEVQRRLRRVKPDLPTTATPPPPVEMFVPQQRRGIAARAKQRRAG